MQEKEGAHAPTYDEIINRTRSMYTENFLFSGTKFELSRSVSPSSFFSLTNTDQGLCLNYHHSAAKNTGSFSVYSNGTILGKLARYCPGGNTAMTLMRSPVSTYFDLTLNKTAPFGSFGVKIINPEFDLADQARRIRAGPFGSGVSDALAGIRGIGQGGAPWFRQKLESAYASRCDFSSPLMSLTRNLTRNLKSKLSRSLVADISSGIRSGLRDLRSTRLAYSGLEQALKKGIFVANGVLQLTPTLHLGMEQVLDINIADAETADILEPQTADILKGKPDGNVEVSSSSPHIAPKIVQTSVFSTYTLSKVFGAVRLLWTCQSTGKIGMSVEKSLGEMRLYADGFLDVHQARMLGISAGPHSRPGGRIGIYPELARCISGVMGSSVEGDGVSTKVSAASDGTVSATSDILLGDGAYLNLSTQLGPGGTQVGIGITIGDI